MPRPDRRQTIAHIQFLHRQRLYESRYRILFQRILDESYSQAADLVAEQGANIPVSQLLSLPAFLKLKKLYYRLYHDITLEEAKIGADFLESIVSGTKDLFDDISASRWSKKGGLLKLWRGLVDAFLEIRIGTKITRVTETTVDKIVEQIQKGVDDGEGALVTAKRIRDSAPINRTRSMAIARTETVTAANQGRFLSAQTSEMEMEKIWIPTLDDRTRDSHRAMYGKPYIGLDQDFEVGTKKGGDEPALYPCDTRLSAENAINCRCGIGFRPKRDPRGFIITK